MRASKGVHIVVPRDRIVAESGLILRTEKSVLFVIPWRNHWIIGTTDTDWHLDLAHPAATKNDIDYLLDHVNAVLATPLTHDDIEGVYAGLRPLLAGESEETSKLSREHAVARVAPGLVAIAGGKYTTYRVMAADAVDAAGVDLPGRARPVDHRPGAAARRGRVPALVNQRSSSADATGCTRTASGTCSTGTARCIARAARALDGGPGAAEPVPAAPDYLRVEVVYAAATRARCTSTTSSPAGPASPSSTRTAASTARSRSPT